MIPFLAPLLAKPALKAVGSVLARWWKFAAGMILGALLCFPLAHCAGEREGRADLLAEQAAAAAVATNRADADEQTRREAAENRADANEGAIRNAVRDNPVEANKAAGPVSRDVLDELRRRRGR